MSLGFFQTNNYTFLCVVLMDLSDLFAVTHVDSEITESLLKLLEHPFRWYKIPASIQSKVNTHNHCSYNIYVESGALCHNTSTFVSLFP